LVGEYFVQLSRFVGAALFAAMSFLSFGAASAQEKSRQTITSCSGAHAGFSLGAARANLDIDYAATPQTGGGFSVLGAANIVAAGTGTIGSAGVVAGGQLGYDWQWGHLVAGGELDLSYTDLSGTRVAPVFNVPDNLHQSFASHLLATVRGRIGYARGPWLVYATGGLALADLTVSDTATSAAVGTAQSSSHELRPGWTVGGGVEWMVMPRWSVKAEYLHADLGTLTDQHVFPGAACGVDSQSPLHRKSGAVRAQLPPALKTARQRAAPPSGARATRGPGAATTSARAGDQPARAAPAHPCPAAASVR
jgi:outer membrane immunogenic protein